jgi:hypothetical protein
MYVYYASMLRCWHLVWILVRTDHPYLGVECHTWYLPSLCLGLRGSWCFILYIIYFVFLLHFLYTHLSHFTSLVILACICLIMLITMLG